MSEPREYTIEGLRFRLAPDGFAQKWDAAFEEWSGIDFAAHGLLREIARLQDENATLRARTDLRDAFRTLFHECRWAWGYEDDALILYYPPGFVIPAPLEVATDFEDGTVITNDDMAAAFSEALTKAPR
jgi:hypothetical protein